MLTLFRVMTFEDWSDVMYETQEVYWWAWLYFISFIFFAAFAFLNMLIGVMVSVMGETKDAIDAEAAQLAAAYIRRTERRTTRRQSRRVD